MTMIDATGVAVALPSIQRSLALDQGQLQWIITIYTLTLASTLATGSRLGDRFGHLRSFVAGVSLFVAGSLICGLSPNLATLLLGRLIEGLGNVFMVPVAAVMASEALGPQQRGRAMGIYSSAGGLSMIAGPLLGGVLTQYAGWRAIFFVNVPIAALTLILFRLARPAAAAPDAHPFDYRQAPLLIAALGMLVLGLQESHNWLWTSALTIGLVAGGLVLLGAFVLLQLREGEPLLDVRLFRYRYFTADAIALYCAQFAVIGQSAFIAVYFQRILQFSPLRSGLAVVCMPLAWVLMSPVAGRMYDRTGIRRPVLIGLALIAGGFAWQVAVLPLRDFPLLVPGLLAIGAGLGLALTQTYTDGMAHVAAESRGQAYGLLDTIRQLGGAMGMAAVGTLVAARETSQIRDIAATHGGTDADRAAFAALLRGAVQGQTDAIQTLDTKWPRAVDALRASGAHSIAAGYGVALGAVTAGLVLIAWLTRGAASAHHPRADAEPTSLVTPTEKEMATP